MRLLTALAALAVAPATAAAAGFPVAGIDTTQTGATTPGNPYRFVALPEGSGATQLVKINRADGMAERHRRLQGVHAVPAVAREVSDVTGAGDTVVATLALALAAGATPAEAAVLANHAAGVVVGKFGPATVIREELLGQFTSGN